MLEKKNDSVKQLQQRLEDFRREREAEVGKLVLIAYLLGMCVIVWLCMQLAAEAATRERMVADAFAEGARTGGLTVVREQVCDVPCFRVIRSFVCWIFPLLLVCVAANQRASGREPAFDVPLRSTGYCGVVTWCVVCISCCRWSLPIHAIPASQAKRIAR